MLKKMIWIQLSVKSHAAAAAKLLQSCPTLRPHRRQPTRLPHPWDSLGKDTGVGCHFLLQCMTEAVPVMSPETRGQSMHRRSLQDQKDSLEHGLVRSQTSLGLHPDSMASSLFHLKQIT